jgi:hypothetical protein
MRKSQNRVRLLVEAMETRALLSGLAPGPSVLVRNAVVAEFGTNLETPAPINSVRLQNNTGHRLVIRAFFKTETNLIRHPDKVIPIGGSGEFIFKPELVGFVQIEVKRDGSLGPFKGPFYLSKPSTGYYGALFRITASNETYTVSGPFS